MKLSDMKTGYRWFWFFIFVAAAIKFSLFYYIYTVIPLNFREQDSPVYLQGAESIWNFYLHPEQGLEHNNQAMPGYPLFLSLCLYGFKLAIHHVIFIQVFLNFVAAFVVSRIARAMNPDWAPVAAIIVLLDFPLTVYSQLIMTEAVYMVALSCFILFFHRYLVKPSYRRLIFAVMTMVLCVYIRPVTCYLAWPVAAFILWFRPAGSWQKNLVHALLVIFIFYGACLPWQYRNLQRYGDPRMSRIADYTLERHSFFKDTAKMKKISALKNTPDFVYYPFAFLRNARELLLTPGSAKSSTLCMSWMIFGKVFGYLFLFFWVPGFVMGMIRRKNDSRYSFLILIFLYFLFATIGGVGWTVTSRFRISMLPAIAVISTAGWFLIQSWWREKGRILWRDRYRLLKQKV